VWASGLSWALTVNNQTYNINTNETTLRFTTGNYSYSAIMPTAAGVDTSSGYVVVSGNTSSYTVNMKFTTGPKYYVTVNVPGFTNSFTLSLNGFPYTTASGQLITVTNGSFTYIANFGASYQEQRGSFTINGANYTLNLNAPVIQTFHYKFTSNYAGFHINIAGYGNTSESGTVLYLNISNYNTTFTAYYQPFFSVSYSPSQNIGDTLYQNFTVTFAAIAHYTYYIYETGLVLGSPFSTTNTWSINYNGTVYSSSVNYIEITTTSTSITFLVYGVDGYSVNHRIITVAETGNNTIYSDLNFTQDANTTPYSIGLLWSYFPYIFTTILVASIFIPIGLVVRRARRKDR
jgi:hypothetical protein